MAFSPIRVLIVEDRAVDARLARVALAMGGFEARTAATLEHARPLLAEFRPDCLVLDIQLPDGSGLDFAREVRRSAAGPGTRIVILTGHAATYGEDDARSAGADAFLTKPFDVRALPGVICAVLEDPSR